MEHNNLMYHPGDPSYPPPEGCPIYAPPPHYAHHAQEDTAHPPPPYYHPPQHHGHGHRHSYPLPPPPPHPYYPPPPPPRYGHPGHHPPHHPPPNNVTHHHHHQQQETTSYQHHPYRRPPLPLPHPSCQYEYGGAPISSNSNDQYPHPHAVVITPTEEIPPHPPRYSIHHPKEEQKSSSISSSSAPSSSSTLYTTKTTTTTTTTRRKKKMYSDFVGVTYNKTHAKFQACITHYRKQHYLGRYKLAVDAALAYDESARLLKGNSWKVNFASRNEYEVAKVKEMNRVTTTIRGGAAPPGAGAGAASCGVNVAGRRVGDMATQDQVLAIARVQTNNVGLGAMDTSIKAESRTAQLLPPAANCGEGSYQDLELISCSPPKRRLDDMRENDERRRVVAQRLSSPSSDAGVIQSPCPSFLPLLTSTHKSLYTPLHDVASPNPACHAMGTTSFMEKGTPDSLIHPTALTYNNISDKKSPSQQQHGGDDEKFSNNYPVGKQEYGECQQSNQQPRSSRAMSKSMATDDSPNSVPPPSVIQNGTLAAASALMTLFGKEKET